MKALRLSGNDENLVQFANILSRSHVLSTLCSAWRSLFGVYDLFRQINLGFIYLYGVFDDDRRLICCGWCEPVKGVLFLHIACLRGVDGELCARKALEIVAIEHPEIKKFRVKIPHDNIAVRRLVKRLGMTLCSKDEDYSVYELDSLNVRKIRTDIFNARKVSPVEH